MSEWNASIRATEMREAAIRNQALEEAKMAVLIYPHAYSRLPTQEELAAAISALKDKTLINSLVAENARLREALERIAANDWEASHFARAALQKDGK